MAVKELKVLQDIDLSQNSIKKVSNIENGNGITLQKDTNSQITINDTTEINAKTEVKLSSGDSNSISITPKNVTISANNALSIKSGNTEITEKKITTPEISSTTTSAGKLDATFITIKNEPNNVEIYWDSKTNSLVFEKA